MAPPLFRLATAVKPLRPRILESSHTRASTYTRDLSRAYLSRAPFRGGVYQRWGVSPHQGWGCVYVDLEVGRQRQLSTAVVHGQEQRWLLQVHKVMYRNVDNEMGRRASCVMQRSKHGWSLGPHCSKRGTRAGCAYAFCPGVFSGKRHSHHYCLCPGVFSGKRYSHLCPAHGYGHRRGSCGCGDCLDRVAHLGQGGPGFQPDPPDLSRDDGV